MHFDLGNGPLIQGLCSMKTAKICMMCIMVADMHIDHLSPPADLGMRLKGLEAEVGFQKVVAKAVSSGWKSGWRQGLAVTKRFMCHWGRKELDGMELRKGCPSLSSRACLRGGTSKSSAASMA